MSKKTDHGETKKAHHALGEDVLLSMGHKKYKATTAYARALLYYATQFNIMQQIRDSFDDFMKVWEGLPIFSRFIQSHAVDRYTRKGCIRHFFGDRIHKGLLYFMEKVIDNDHTDLMPGIYNAFRQMVHEVDNRRTLRVISAFPMNLSQKKRLEYTMENLLKMTITIKNEVDPGILGGFICYTDSIKIDMSLNKDLNKLKSQILSVHCEGDEKI